MNDTAYVSVIPRENLSEFINSDGMRNLDTAYFDRLDQINLGNKDFLVGFWNRPNGDPYPDFIAVNDEAYSDMQAWLAAFMANAAPISQWCRVWRLNELRNIRTVKPTPSLGVMSGSWVGAIIAEFSAHNPNINLKEASGANFLNCANFCAARAIAVWDEYGGFDDIAERYDTLLGTRFSSRAYNAQDLVPLWYVLAGERWVAKAPAYARAIEPFRQLVELKHRSERLPSETLIEFTKHLSVEFELNELEKCAAGPQGPRVDALDKLAAKLLSGPVGPVTSALLGFGANLVDPGAAVMPELLKRYSRDLPTASAWAGAFAGMFSPVRVLSDHSGVGRLIAKQITAASDILTKPSGDIGFDEFARWTGGTFHNGPSPIRGLLNRMLFLELVPGVTLPISAVRSDAQRTDSRQTTGARQTSLDLGISNMQAGRRPYQAAASGGEDELVLRVERLEKAVASILDKSSKPSRGAPRNRSTSRS